jgi:hypothetical protein
MLKRSTNLKKQADIKLTSAFSACQPMIEKEFSFVLTFIYSYLNGFLIFRTSFLFC